MTKDVKKPEDRVWDQASLETLIKAERDCVDTCFTRLDAQPSPCRFGTEGLCCRICYMGPCRITNKAPRGVCGADADTIVARNFLREVAGGTAAHSDHGRHLVLLLKQAAEGRIADYVIRDEKALRRIAKGYGIEEQGRTKEAVALELADLLLKEFMLQEESLLTLRLS
ncbi:MAG: carbon monoxide dehydrogenase, partial [Deltaproteobacteria bacterium]